MRNDRKRRAARLRKQRKEKTRKDVALQQEREQARAFEYGQNAVQANEEGRE